MRFIGPPVNGVMYASYSYSRWQVYFPELSPCPILASRPSPAWPVDR